MQREHFRIRLFAAILRLLEWILLVWTIAFALKAVNGTTYAGAPNRNIYNPGSTRPKDFFAILLAVPLLAPAVFVWLTGTISNITYDRDGLSPQQRFAISCTIGFVILLHLTFGMQARSNTSAALWGEFLPLSLLAGTIYKWIGWTTGCKTRLRNKWIQNAVARIDTNGCNE